MNFVSGGTGIVGSHFILNLLQKGEQVLASKRSASNITIVKDLAKAYDLNLDFGLLRWIDLDFEQPLELENILFNVKRVFHCAAFVSFNRNDINDLLLINFEGTKNIVNASLQAGVDEFIYISSTAALAADSKHSIIDERLETDAWQKKFSAYGLSKKLAELEVWRGAEEGLKVLIVNPAIIIGPGDWGKSSTTLFTQINKGMPFYPSGENGFVHVGDVVKSVFELLQQKVHNQRFLLCAENLSFKSVFQKIALSIGKKPPRIKIKKSALLLFYYLSEAWHFIVFKKPQLTLHGLKSASKKTHFSNDKIKKTIGFEFTPIDLAIEQTAAIFLKQMKNK